MNPSSIAWLMLEKWKSANSPSARFAAKSSSALGLGVAVNANSERLGMWPRLASAKLAAWFTPRCNNSAKPSSPCFSPGQTAVQ